MTLGQKISETNTPEAAETLYDYIDGSRQRFQDKHTNIDEIDDADLEDIFRDVHDFANFAQAKDLTYGLVSNKTNISPVKKIDFDKDPAPKIIDLGFGIFDPPVIKRMAGNQFNVPVQARTRPSLGIKALKILHKKRTDTDIPPNTSVCLQNLFDIVTPVFEHTAAQLSYRKLQKIPAGFDNIEIERKNNVTDNDLPDLVNHAAIFQERTRIAEMELLQNVAQCRGTYGNIIRAYYTTTIAKLREGPTANDARTIERRQKLIQENRDITTDFYTFLGKREADDTYSGILGAFDELSIIFKNPTLFELAKELETEVKRNEEE